MPSQRKSKQREVVVAQAEFAYNYSKNRTIGKSPFEVVHGKQPVHLYDLAPLPEWEEMV